MSFRDLTTAAVLVLLVWTTNSNGGESDVVFQDGFEDSSIIPLLCGAVLSGEIAVSGEEDMFTFTGTTDDVVDVVLTETGLDWGGSCGAYDPRATIFSPSGIEVDQFDANTRRTLTLLETGTYLVRINANQLTATGTYNLGLTCLGSAPVEDLVLVEQYLDGIDGVTGLDVGNHSLSLSPDGCHLYAAGGHFAFSDQPNRGALVVFDRNDADGRLTHLQSLIHGENVSLMVAASDTAVSPDGRHVYVAASTTSFFGGRYLVFDRAADGLLTERTAYNGGWLNRAIEISPDGNSVYIGGGHGLLSLTRAADGTLSSISDSEEPGAFDVDDITMSRDGTSLYTAGSRCPTGSGNCFPLIYGVVPMTRDTTTGALVAGEPIERPELAGTRRLELSRDGRYLFASGAGITVFQRAEDGTLTFLSYLAGVGGGGNVDKLPLSSDGQRLFANGELVDSSDPTSLSVVDDTADEVGFGASGHTADPGFRHLYSIGWDTSSETYILSLFHLEGR